MSCKQHFFFGFLVICHTALSIAMLAVPHTNMPSCCIPESCGVDGLRALNQGGTSWVNRGVPLPQSGHSNALICQFTPQQYDAMNCTDISSYPTNRSFDTCQWEFHKDGFWMILSGSTHVCALPILCVFVYYLPRNEDPMPTAAFVCMCCVFLAIIAVSIVPIGVLLQTPYHTAPVRGNDNGSPTLPPPRVKIAGKLRDLKALKQVYRAEDVFVLQCLNAVFSSAVCVHLLCVVAWRRSDQQMPLALQAAKNSWDGLFWFCHCGDSEEAEKLRRVREKMKFLQTKMASLRERLDAMKLRHQLSEHNRTTLAPQQQECGHHNGGSTLTIEASASLNMLLMEPLSHRQHPLDYSRGSVWQHRRGEHDPLHPMPDPPYSTPRSMYPPVQRPRVDPDVWRRADQQCYSPPVRAAGNAQLMSL